MTCARKPLKSEQQARVVAQLVGQKKGVQYYPDWCQTCRAYHVTRGK